MKRYLISLVTRETRERKIKTTSIKIAKTKKKNYSQECGSTELLVTMQNGITSLGEKKRTWQYLLNQDLCLPVSISELYNQHKCLHMFALGHLKKY